MPLPSDSEGGPSWLEKVLTCICVCWYYDAHILVFEVVVVVVVTKAESTDPGVDITLVPSLPCPV